MPWCQSNQGNITGQLTTNLVTKIWSPPSVNQDLSDTINSNHRVAVGLNYSITNCPQLVTQLRNECELPLCTNSAEFLFHHAVFSAVKLRFFITNLGCFALNSYHITGIKHTILDSLCNHDTYNNTLPFITASKMPSLQYQCV